jgi:Mg2+ and Co2+ transporter CorA
MESIKKELLKININVLDLENQALINDNKLTDTKMVLKIRSKVIKLEKEYREFIYKNKKKDDQNIDNIINRIEKRLDIINDLNKVILDKKLNEQQKILTIINAIFLPLGILVGYFGMNFKYFESILDIENPHIFMFIMFMVLGTVIYYSIANILAD